MTRSPTDYKIVSGLHPETPVPRQIRTWGWAHRLGFVLSSYQPGFAEMYLDAKLLLSLLQVFDDLLCPEKREVRIFNPYLGRYVSLAEFGELREFYRNLGEDDWDLPEEITWWKRGALVARAFPERWNAVGGPSPYHDSFTLSIYSREFVAPAFKERLAEGAAVPGNLSEWIDAG